MSLDNNQNLFGRLMISIDGTTLSTSDKDLIRNRHVGGIILFTRNFHSQPQIEELCSEIKNIKNNIIIAVDQEGGRVQRFNGEYTQLPSMQVLGNHCISNNNYSFAADVGWLMSLELIASGVDISFAPVLDVDRNTSSIIGNRSFSNKPQNVVDIASHFIQGMSEAGMQATIIERESGLQAERARIAGVFANRLHRGMRLQSDPTTIYGLGASYDGALTKAQLRGSTAFNTYTINGLPPTPIALSSLSALKAAVRPEDHNYLYFVADGEGGHVFSETLEQHNQAVRSYRQTLSIPDEESRG